MKPTLFGFSTATFNKKEVRASQHIKDQPAANDIFSHFCHEKP
jgi:hypothetical protein